MFFSIPSTDTIGRKAFDSTIIGIHPDLIFRSLLQKSLGTSRTQAFFLRLSATPHYDVSLFVSLCWVGLLSVVTQARKLEAPRTSHLAPRSFSCSRSSLFLQKTIDLSLVAKQYSSCKDFQDLAFCLFGLI